MHTRPVPSSGEAMPVIGLGTWQGFDIGEDPAERAPRREVLEALFAAGGRMIDCSPMYGRAESVTGSLLAEMKSREKAYLATKVWTTGEAAGVAQMQASAEKLRTPVIDLMQIHNLVDWRTQLRTLHAWKAKGTVRHIGITHYTSSAHDDLMAIMRAERIDFVQVNYSLSDRAAEDRLLPLAAERGIAVIANRPFGSGGMFGRVRGQALPAWADEIDAKSFGQIFLKHLIGHAAVTSVIPGTAKPEHMRDNAAAGVGRLPDNAFRQRIAAWWDAL